MIDNKSLQRALQTMVFYEGPVDGIIGPLTQVAISRALTKFVGMATSKWSDKKKFIAFNQLVMHSVGIDVGTIDGMWGPQSRYALEKWQDRLRAIPGTDPAPPKSDSIKVGDPVSVHFPTQAEVPKHYGAIGKHLVPFTPPYTFKLYDGPKTISKFDVHEKIAMSLLRVLTKVHEWYGPDRIDALHLNRFFGCYNPRKMRGGNSWSMHSWGIALDFDANRNQLRWGRDKAAFAKADYNDWWKAWESENWVSLGRERNYDWMHVQAARL